MAWFAAVFAVMLLAFGGLQTADAAVMRVAFTPADAEIANPERGFYRAARTDLDALGAAEVAEAYAAGFRLIYVRIDLEAYRDAVLPADYLQALDAGFAAARAGGVKLILRATYNYPRGETEYRDAQDAPLARVLGHLAQLKPVLERNADVIAFVQAGFIGAWGEWHTSSNALTESEARARIRDALFDAVPVTRFIQFRYPPYIRDWAPTLPQLNAALSGAFRIGLHNDCFLASATDVGTYSEDASQRAVEQAAMDALGDLAPYGGETCNPVDEERPTPRTGCADILAEGARYNLTYLNDGYYRRLFHDSWRRDGCMPEVSRRMGYRLALVHAEHEPHATRGETFALSLAVRNAGWARLYNPRPIELVLRHAETGAVRRIAASGAEARTWLPGAEAAQTLSVVLPDELPAGAYDVLLALPDADARLAADARFAVRFANADDAAHGQRWDATLGAFALGTSVTIR